MLTLTSSIWLNLVPFSLHPSIWRWTVRAKYAIFIATNIMLYTCAFEKNALLNAKYLSYKLT